MKKAMYVLVVILTACNSQAEEAETICRPAGCSGQLCLPVAEAIRITTTCEWKDAYQCYKEVGVCEVQADGSCGWTPSDALQACLQNPRGYEKDKANRE